MSRLPTSRPLCLQDRLAAKYVAAVKRQGVIEDMEDFHLVVHTRFGRLPRLTSTSWAGKFEKRPSTSFLITRKSDRKVPYSRPIV